MALIEINWQPSRRELRQFAGIWFPAFCALVGGLIYYRTGSLSVPAIIWSAAAAISVLGFLVPAFIKPIFLGMIAVTWPIGWVVSHLLIAAVYYLVITPVGLAMKLVGYDPMQRRIDRAAKTYWAAHNPGGEADRYFRQL